MDFEQLRIFLVLAEERTFLGAANRLATSRSRVRRKLDQLEKAAGTALVSREQSGLVLTSAGEALVLRGRALLDDAEHLIAHVRDVGNEPTGCLVIAMPNAPAPAGWDDLCRSVQQRYPALRLELRFDEAPTRLLPGHAEIALTFEDEIPPGCEVVEMGEFPMRLFVSEAYLASRGSPQTIDDLAGHRIGTWRRSDRSPGRIALRDGRELQVEPAISSEDPTQVHRMAAAGDCIAYLPALPQLDDPALKLLFPEQLSGFVCQRLVVPSILVDVPRIQRFVEMSASLSPASLVS